jgi:hypothetical protein
MVDCARLDYRPIAARARPPVVHAVAWQVLHLRPLAETTRSRRFLATRWLKLRHARSALKLPQKCWGAHSVLRTWKASTAKATRPRAVKLVVMLFGADGGTTQLETTRRTLGKRSMVCRLRRRGEVYMKACLAVKVQRRSAHLVPFSAIGSAADSRELTGGRPLTCTDADTRQDRASILQARFFTTTLSTRDSFHKAGHHGLANVRLGTASARAVLTLSLWCRVAQPCCWQGVVATQLSPSPLVLYAYQRAAASDTACKHVGGHYLETGPCWSGGDEPSLQRSAASGIQKTR